MYAPTVKENRAVEFPVRETIVIGLVAPHVPSPPAPPAFAFDPDAFRSCDAQHALSIRLCLAGPSGYPICFESSCGSDVLAIIASENAFDMERIGERSLRHAAEGLAGGALTALLIRSKVEGDEEDEIRAENCNA